MSPEMLRDAPRNRPHSRWSSACAREGVWIDTESDCCSCCALNTTAGLLQGELDVVAYGLIECHDGRDRRRAARPWVSGRTS